jgi:hypothetical protein
VKTTLGPMGTWLILVLVAALGMGLVFTLAAVTSVDDVASIDRPASAHATDEAKDAGKDDFGIGHALQSYVVTLSIALAVLSGIYLLYRFARIGGGVEAELAKGQPTPSMPLLGTPSRSIRTTVSGILLAYAAVGVVTVLHSAFSDKTRPSACIVAILAVVIGSFTGLSGVLTGSDLDPAIRDLAALTKGHGGSGHD